VNQAHQMMLCVCAAARTRIRFAIFTSRKQSRIRVLDEQSSSLGERLLSSTVTQIDVAHIGQDKRHGSD
jgi:hypothetical protein